MIPNSIAAGWKEERFSFSRKLVHDMQVTGTMNCFNLRCDSRHVNLSTNSAGLFVKYGAVKCHIINIDLISYSVGKNHECIYVAASEWYAVLSLSHLCKSAFEVFVVCTLGHQDRHSNKNSRWLVENVTSRW